MLYLLSGLIIFCLSIIAYRVIGIHEEMQEIAASLHKIANDGNNTKNNKSKEQ